MNGSSSSWGRGGVLLFYAFDSSWQDLLSRAEDIVLVNSNLPDIIVISPSQWGQIMIFISMLVIWVNISKNNIFEAIWWSVHQLFNARGRCDHATVLSTIAPFIKKNEERLKRFTRKIWMWWQRHIAPDNSHVLIRFSKPLFACQAIK